jgi:hypothetical protein
MLLFAPVTATLVETMSLLKLLFTYRTASEPCRFRLSHTSLPVCPHRQDQTLRG